MKEHEEKSGEGVPVAEPTVALSAASPRRVTGSGLSAPIAHALAHGPRKIRFEFYNGFDRSSLGGGTFDYNAYKCMNGGYTKIWRVFKPGLANLFKLDKRLVRARPRDIRAR